MKTAHVIWGLTFCFVFNLFAVNNSPESDIISEKLDQDSTIIYTVEYGPKPLSPPTLEPEWQPRYLSFENVYVVTDNWYYASRQRAESVKADAFLIPGGSTSDVPFYDGSLDSYVDLLRNPGRPTFGFCAGHQFLQMAYGGICAERSGERGYEEATIFKDNTILASCPNPYSAYAAHSYSIVDIPNNYINYATTRTCYSTFVQHITMPLYGTQLHIENTRYPSSAGPIILGNFQNQVMTRKFHGVAEVLAFPGEPGKVLVTWWKAKTSENVVYHICHSTEKDEFSFDVPAYETTELEYEITGLTEDITHYFAVRAVSSAFTDSNTAIFPIKPDGHHTLVLQNGLDTGDQIYDGTEATVVYNKYPDSNYGSRGASDADILYWWDSGLIKFRGLEEYLTGKTIIGGKLTFIFVGGVDESTTGDHEAHIGIYRVLKKWNEGQGRDHSDAQSGEVTWNSARHNIETWELPGAQGSSDRIPDPIASYTIKGDGTGIAFDGTVTLPAELIQTWVDYPDSNCGLLYEKIDTYPSDTYFYFEDNDDSWFMNHPRLTVYYLDNTGTTLAHEQSENIPEVLVLQQNYPNPFNASTRIRFTLSEPKYVTLEVYNALGQRIETLLSRKYIPAGSHEVNFNAGRLASGLYYYRIAAGNFCQTAKMVLLK